MIYFFLFSGFKVKIVYFIQFLGKKKKNQEFLTNP